jgi:hypothetical protein
MCRQNSTFKNCKVLVNDSVTEFDLLKPQQFTFSSSYTFRPTSRQSAKVLKVEKKEHIFTIYGITDLSLSYELSQGLLLTPTRT